MAIILGIDPGSRVTGYGVIRQVGRQLSYLGSGCIRTKVDAITHCHVSQNAAQISETRLNLARGRLR